MVNPGDVIVADDDGVVVVARELAEAAVVASAERTAKEDRMRQRLAAGELGLDIYGIRTKLSDMGLQYHRLATDENGAV